MKNVGDLIRRTYLRKKLMKLVSSNLEKSSVQMYSAGRSGFPKEFEIKDFNKKMWVILMTRQRGHEKTFFIEGFNGWYDD